MCCGEVYVGGRTVNVCCEEMGKVCGYVLYLYGWCVFGVVGADVYVCGEACVAEKCVLWWVWWVWMTIIFVWVLCDRMSIDYRWICDVVIGDVPVRWLGETASSSEININIILTY